MSLIDESVPGTFCCLFMRDDATALMKNRIALLQYRAANNVLPSTVPVNLSKNSPGIQLTQQTGLGSDTGMCHSGQAKRRAGISSFLARA